MTAKEMSKAIGQKVVLDDHGLSFICIVEDVKHAYGSVRLLIVPIAGSGQRWVEFSSVRPHNPSVEIKRTQPSASQPSLPPTGYQVTNHHTLEQQKIAHGSRFAAAMKRIF